MKKYLFWAILPFLLFIHILRAPVFLVSAQTALVSTPTQGDYACILDEAFFYSAPDERTGLFLLPKTYYVRLIEYGTEYCKIEYNADDTQPLVGYAKTYALTFVEYQPKRPYLSYSFDLTYRLENTDKTGDLFLTELTVTCAYYGDYKIGSQTFCYVSQNGSFGYVPKPFSLVYEENTEYADYLESQQTGAPAPDDKPSSSKTGISPVSIAILIALCLLVPLLATLVLRPPRRPPYDLED